MSDLLQLIVELRGCFSMTANFVVRITQLYFAGKLLHFLWVRLKFVKERFQIWGEQKESFLLLKIKGTVLFY